MDFRIDPSTDQFLLDHTVDGLVIVPTVLQLDLAVQTLIGGDGVAGLLAEQVVVGPVLTMAAQSTVSVRGEVDWRGETSRVELRSLAGPHLSVTLSRPGEAVPTPRDLRPALPEPRTARVYPPFFHGPHFQVVGAVGEQALIRTAWLADGLPPLRWSFGPTVTGPRTLELLLQCCGLADLDDGYGMRIPASIEAVRWYAAPHGREPVGAVAVVRPRPVPAADAGADAGARTFDGEVYAPDGPLLLAVHGYRTHAMASGAPPIDRTADRPTHTDREALT